MKLIVLITSIIAFLLSSCQNKAKINQIDTFTDKEAYFEPGYEYVQQTPDSLRTPEQKELIKKITIVILENTVVRDNELVFNLNKQDFMKKGIPIQYYDLVQKDILNNNQFFKDNNISNVDSILKESNKQNRVSLGLDSI